MEPGLKIEKHHTVVNFKETGRKPKISLQLERKLMQLVRDMLVSRAFLSINSHGWKDSLK